MAVSAPFYAYLEELRALQGEPKVTYPNGDRSYPVVERVRKMYRTDAALLLPGAVEPNATRFPRHFLTGMEELQGDEQQVEVYLKYESAPAYPSGQNAWSFQLQYVSAGVAYPIFIRETVEPRPYTAATRGAPLTAVTEIRVTNGGSAYTSAPTVTIGGPGAGAAAIAHIVGGVVARVELTAGGSAYVTVPAITFAGGGGAGVAATATIQSQGAKLVNEETRPAEGVLAHDFVLVTRTYKTLPGPELTGQILDKRTGLIFQLKVQDVLASEAIGVVPAGNISFEIQPVDTVQSRKSTVSYLGGGAIPSTVVDKQYDDVIRGSIWEVEIETAIADAEPDVENDSFGGRWIIDYAVRPHSPTHNITTLWTIAAPGTWSEFPERGEQFPAVFDFLVSSGDAPSIAAFNRPGVVFNFLAHRTDEYTQLHVHQFSRGTPQGSSFPTVFRVRSPGAASRVFGMIGANTIHPAFTIYDADGVLEIIPASTPSVYNEREILFRGVDARPWRGNVYHLVLRFSCESGFNQPTGTPGTGIRECWLAESDDGGLYDPDAQTRLVYDGGLSDTFTTWGTADGEQVSESATIGTYGPVRGESRFSLIFAQRITSTGLNAFDPRVRATGRKQIIRAEFAVNPAPGATFSFVATQARYSPTSDAYTFVNTEAWILVSGTATLDAVSVGGYYYATGAVVNGVPRYDRLDGVFKLTSDGISDYLIEPVVPTGSNFHGGTHLIPASTGGAYVGTGTFSVAIPTVGAIIPAVSINAFAQQVKLGLTVNATLTNLQSALLADLAGAGTLYATGTLRSRFFWDDEEDDSVTLGTAPDRLLLTDHVADEHALTYDGTAAATITTPTTGDNGKLIARGANGEDQYRYNQVNFYNVDYRLVVPPLLVAAPTEPNVFAVAQANVSACYRMEAGVSISYEVWTGAAWVAGATSLETIDGDNVNEVELGEATIEQIRFLITNSSGEAKRLRLFLKYPLVSLL